MSTIETPHRKRPEEMVFKRIDRKSPEILQALAEAPIYKKLGLKLARQAIEGEHITTVLENGAIETTDTAKVGDWVVTNPSGEQYIIGKAKFEHQYEPTETEGVYHAKGYCRAVRNPFGTPIEIMAPWGFPEKDDEHCFIADGCDANGENMSGEPYLIDGAAFEKTYTPC